MAYRLCRYAIRFYLFDRFVVLPYFCSVKTKKSFKVKSINIKNG